MAASSCSGREQVSDEETINRWTFEYYVFKAFDAFRKGDYAGFVQFRNIIENLMVRPISGDTDMMIKLRFMQFLSRINDGDKLDVTFENPLMPLESALNVLESIFEEMNVTQSVLERVHVSVKEMLVVVCIKNKQFEKAQEMLLKHFPKGMDSAGKKKLLVELIRRRCNTHSILNISYSEFKQDMLDFTDKFCHHPEPFLSEMLKQRVGNSTTTEVNRTQNGSSHGEDRTMRSPEQINEPVVLEHCSPSDSQENTPNKRKVSKDSSSSPVSSVFLSLNNLRTSFRVLSQKYGVTINFDQLEEEVEREAQEYSRVDCEMREPFLRLSETPVDTVLVEIEQRTCAGSRGESEGSASQTASGVLEDAACQTEVNLPQQLTEPHDDSDTRSSVVGRNVTPTTSEQRHAQVPDLSPENRERTHGSAVSAVTVAQLVMGEDSQPSEVDIMSSRSPSPVKAGSSGEDPFNSLPVSSTPVRKCRRPAGLRKSIPSEPEPASPQQPTEPQNFSTPSSPQTTQNTPEMHQRNKKWQHSEGQSEESIIIDSPPSTRKPHSNIRRNRWMDVSGVQEEWSDEESLFPAATTKKNTGANSTSENQGKRKVWTEEESDWVRKGVARYGVGHWEKIRTAYPFNGRTAVNIKDRYRTMKKLKIV